MPQNPSGFVERPKVTARNRYVITDELARRVWQKMQSAPVLGGDIANLIWGTNSNRPVSKSAFHESMRQLNKIWKREYGLESMSTVAYRPEQYPGEKDKRRR